MTNAEGRSAEAIVTFVGREDYLYFEVHITTLHIYPSACII